MFTVSCGAIICLLLDLLRIIFKSGRKKIPVGLKKMTSRKVEPGMDLFIRRNQKKIEKKFFCTKKLEIFSATRCCFFIF